jgi:hypothetical protein
MLTFMNDFKLEIKHQIALVHEKLEAINRKLEIGSGPTKHPPTAERPQASGEATGETPAARFKEAKSLKRSFLARFLEDDDDHPAAKAKLPKVTTAWSRLLESVFGICDADHKQGREASSVIHPHSPFATGPRARHRRPSRSDSPHRSRVFPRSVAHSALRC